MRTENPRRGGPLCPPAPRDFIYAWPMTTGVGNEVDEFLVVTINQAGDHGGSPLQYEKAAPTSRTV